MLSQAGFGMGTTRLHSMPGSAITFNTRDISALGIDMSSIPTFQNVNIEDGSFPTFDTEFVAEKSIEIANFIYDIFPFDLASVIGMTKEEFIVDILKAQDPLDFLAGQLLSRVQIGMAGDLYVKEYSPLKGLGEISAEWLNVNEICENAKKLYEKNINIADVKPNIQ